MPIDENQSDFSVMLSRMASWLILSYHGDNYGYPIMWGPKCELDQRTIFLSARAFSSLCAAYSYIVKENFFKENKEKINFEELDIILEDVANWFISKSVNNCVENTIFWWSGDNTPLEITRSTCAVLNALMEYRERLHEKSIEFFLNEDKSKQIKYNINRINETIERGINWIFHNITIKNKFVTNATTGDQAVLFEGGLSNIPSALYDALIEGDFNNIKTNSKLIFDCEEFQKNKYQPISIIKVGRSFMGDSFNDLLTEKGLQSLKFKFDSWATAECLYTIIRQLEYNRKNSYEGSIISNIELISTIERFIQALKISQNTIGIWETEHACANFFIVDYIYYIYKILGPSYIESDDLIKKPLRTLFGIIIENNKEYSDLEILEKIWLEASNLPDLCSVFALVLYRLMNASFDEKIKDYLWFYQNLLQFKGRRLTNSDMYLYVPSNKEQIDKTSWAIICISKILEKCGLNQRRLFHFKKWALSFHLAKTFGDAFGIESTFKLLFVPKESRYYLFLFTHDLNLKFLKKIMDKKESIKWIDLGCGNGRNLDLLVKLHPEQRKKLQITGLDFRNKNLKQEFIQHYNKWFPNLKKKYFIKEELSEFSQINSFDFATASLLIHEISVENILSSLKNSINCLKNNGILVLIDLIDYQSNELGIVTWDMDDIKSILKLFSSFIRIETSEVGFHEIRYSYMSENIQYYCVSVRKLKNITKITKLQQEKLTKLLKRKIKKLEEMKSIVNNQIQEKIKNVIPKSKIEKINTPRMKLEEMKKIIDEEKYINKIEIEDIQNCFRTRQLASQISTISKYLEEIETDE